jgi:diguanylate cyclase (GGDEF)-like protein
MRKPQGQNMGAQLRALEAQIVFRSSHKIFRDLAKRLFDFMAALLGLILLAPLFAFVAILIKRDSRGPVFFRGPRVGKDGRQFRILKFRTMYEDASSYSGPCLTSCKDKRITPLGHWLRNTKINELPQLWNVLMGEMSLVGPRPEAPEIVKTYSLDTISEILSVRPGITSPASVLYNDEQNLLPDANLMGKYLKEILPDKLRLDQLYVRNHSFSSDLDIVFWTLAILTPRLIRSNIPENSLFAGPFSRFAHRHFSWFTVDLVVALIAVSITAVAWRMHNPLDWGLNYLVMLALSLALMFSAVNYFAGFNGILWSTAPAENAIGLVFSSGLVTLGAVMINHLQGVYRWLPVPPLRIELLLSIGLLAHVGFVAVRYRLRLLYWFVESVATLQKNTRSTGEPVLILGTGETCQIASWLLRRGMFRHVFSVVGIITEEDPTRHGMRINGCQVIGSVRELPDLIERHDVRAVIYTLGSAAARVRDTIFSLSRNSKVKLVFLDDLLGFVQQLNEKPADSSDYLEWLEQRSDPSPIHDPVTGLPNSTLLQERLQHSLAYAKRYNTSPALMLINLDGSADVSEVMGRKAEDELLRTVTRRLMTFRRESDTLARSDGHEFALLLENVPSREAAEIILARTRALMAAPFSVKDMEVTVHADIGLYRFQENLEEVFDRMSMKNGQISDPVANQVGSQ